MKDALRAQFKDMQELHPPRAEFVHALEAQLASTRPSTTAPEHFPGQLSQAFNRLVELLVPARLAPMAQRLGTVVFVGGIAIGGWIGAVSASYNAVPGEALYNVKLATERVQLAAVEATGDKTKTAKLHSSFAERRADEVKRVIEKNKEPEQAKAAMALLTKSVNDANNAIKEAQDNPETSEAALETTEELIADNERIAASLREVLNTLPENVSDLINDIVVLHGDLTEKRLSTLQDIVRKQLEGASNLSEEETHAIVVRALKQISDSTNEAVALAKELEANTEAAIELEDTLPDTELPQTTVVVSSTEDATTTQLTEATSSTMEQAPANDTTSTPITEVVQLSDIDGISADVQTDIETVESLVNQGNLLEALEKAKGINTKQVEIEQVVKKAVLQTGGQIEKTEVTTPKDTSTTVATPTPADAVSTTSEEESTTQTTTPTDPSTTTLPAE